MSFLDAQLSSLIPSRSLRIALYASVGVASLIALRSHGNYLKQEKLRRAIPSPLKTLVPLLSDEEVSSLPYPPDVLPGARDVDTPYGSIRVYEWGPETGRKVLLIHGISTPCISLAGVANKLVEKGCRVMLFDLFGRGYSSTPAALPHDSRLYTSQILLVLASSPLPWTGTNAFSLIGYSLGGGIGAAFTSYYPHLVASLVLIAPSGILREEHIASQSKLLYRTEGIVPERFIHWLVKRRLQAGPIVPPKKRDDRHDMGVAPAVSTEPAVVADRTRASAFPPRPDGRTASVSLDQNSPLWADRPHITVPAAVQWQLRVHQGFITAFISAIRYAPITNCHKMWARIGQRLSTQNLNPATKEATTLGLTQSKVLVVLGKEDQIIILKEIEEDAAKVFGPGNVEFVEIDAAHELPITRAKDIVDSIWRFWADDTVSSRKGS